MAPAYQGKAASRDKNACHGRKARKGRGERGRDRRGEGGDGPKKFPLTPQDVNNRRDPLLAGYRKKVFGCSA
eukprot:3635241-Karenia_brevis.AAC.1